MGRPQTLAFLKQAFRLDEALFAYQAPELGEAADKAPKDAEAQAAAAVAWFGRGDSKKARAYADACAALNPKEARAALVRANLSVDAGDGKGALEALKVLEEQGLDGPDIQSLKARAARVAAAACEVVVAPRVGGTRRAVSGLQRVEKKKLQALTFSASSSTV